MEPLKFVLSGCDGRVEIKEVAERDIYIEIAAVMNMSTRRRLTSLSRAAFKCFGNIFLLGATASNSLPLHPPSSSMGHVVCSATVVSPQPRGSVEVAGPAPQITSSGTFQLTAKLQKRSIGTWEREKRRLHFRISIHRNCSAAY